MAEKAIRKKEEEALGTATEGTKQHINGLESPVEG